MTLSDEYVNYTVSTGTLDTKDLIIAFLSFIISVDIPLYKRIISHSPTIYRDNHLKNITTDDEWYNTEEAYEFLDEIFDNMNEIAPNNTIFSSHEGDGSDFGFWLCEEI